MSQIAHCTEMAKLADLVMPRKSKSKFRELHYKVSLLRKIGVVLKCCSTNSDSLFDCVCFHLHIPSFLYLYQGLVKIENRFLSQKSLYFRPFIY